MNKGFKYYFMIIALMFSQSVLGMQALAKKQNTILARAALADDVNKIIQEGVSNALAGLYVFYKDLYENPDAPNIMMRSEEITKKALAEIQKKFNALKTDLKIKDDEIKKQLMDFNFEGRSTPLGEIYDGLLHGAYTTPLTFFQYTVLGFPQPSIDYEKAMKELFGQNLTPLTEENASKIASKLQEIAEHINTKCAGKGDRSRDLKYYIEKIRNALTSALKPEQGSELYLSTIVPGLTKLNAALSDIEVSPAAKEEKIQKEKWMQQAKPLLEKIEKTRGDYAYFLYFEKLGLPITRKKADGFLFNVNTYATDYKKEVSQLEGRPDTEMKRTLNDAIDDLSISLREDRVRSQYAGSKDYLVTRYVKDKIAEIKSVLGGRPAEKYASLKKTLQERLDALEKPADKTLVENIITKLDEAYGIIAPDLKKDEEEALKRQESIRNVEDTVSREIAQKEFEIYEAAYENPTQSNQANRDAYEVFKAQKAKEIAGKTGEMHVKDGQFTDSMSRDISTALQTLYVEKVALVPVGELSKYLDGIEQQIEKSRGTRQVNDAKNYAMGLLNAIKGRRDVSSWVNKKQEFNNPQLKTQFDKVRTIVANVTLSQEQIEAKKEEANQKIQAKLDSIFNDEENKKLVATIAMAQLTYGKFMNDGKLDDAKKSDVKKNESFSALTQNIWSPIDIIMKEYAFAGVDPNDWKKRIQVRISESIDEAYKKSINEQFVFAVLNKATLNDKPVSDAIGAIPKNKQPQEVALQWQPIFKAIGDTITQRLQELQPSQERAKNGLTLKFIRYMAGMLAKAAEDIAKKAYPTDFANNEQLTAIKAKSEEIIKAAKAEEQKLSPQSK